MNKTTHSPGPWIAYNSDGNSGRILKHWRIRGACVRNDPPFAVIDSKGKLSPEYEYANALLIAAAPDLLDALEEIEGLPCDDNGDRIIPAGFLDNARQAIAKARGQA